MVRRPAGRSGWPASRCAVSRRLVAAGSTLLAALSEGKDPARLPGRRLLASLEHPNLMRYYEAFVDEQQLFIVTELVPKGDLGTLLE